MEQEGNGRPPTSMKNQQGRFSTWPVSDPVRPALAPASPAPTGPWTGANRVIYRMLESSLGRGPVAGPVWTGLVRSCARSDRVVDRAPRRQPATASAGQFLAPVKTKPQLRFGPAGPVPGPV